MAHLSLYLGDGHSLQHHIIRAYSRNYFYAYPHVYLWILINIWACLCTQFLGVFMDEHLIYPHAKHAISSVIHKLSFEAWYLRIIGIISWLLSPQISHGTQTDDCLYSLIFLAMQCLVFLVCILSLHSRYICDVLCYLSLFTICVFLFCVHLHQ
eukprot:154912_1